MSESQNIGKIVQVIGPVVDLEFPEGNLPEIYNAIRIDNEENDIHLTMETMKQLGDNRVRTVAMDSTDGLAAAVCHFYNANNGSSAASYSSWSSFVKKNQDKIN